MPKMSHFENAIIRKQKYHNEKIEKYKCEKFENLKPRECENPADCRVRPENESRAGSGRPKVGVVAAPRAASVAEDATEMAAEAVPLSGAGVWAPVRGHAGQSSCSSASSIAEFHAGASSERRLRSSFSVRPLRPLVMNRRAWSQ